MRGPAARLLALGWLLIAAVLCALPAFAATFAVSNTNDSGRGSLRQAILDANNSTGTDTISFNIGGGGVHTIAPVTPLPQITDPVVVDGFTQPGSKVNNGADGMNAVLRIELSGSGITGT